MPSEAVPIRILIAEDSASSRCLLEASLRKWGYEVVAASDGNEAWDRLQRPDAPRLAILDWMMPGLSGLEVCRRVRALRDNRYTYILLVTSRTQREDLIEGLEAGADDYVTKPFDQQELRVRLEAGRRILRLEEALLAAQAALREQATTDELTGLWNRRMILELLERELARTEREGTPLGVVVGDLDRFKRVNDTHGHLAGDGVLREVAQRMRVLCRNYDSVGRYGGEEFLLILPGCDVHAAESHAERLRIAIESRPVETAEGTVAVTCSFGATSVPGGRRATAKAVIRVADNALYRAKKAGRNCVARLPFA